MGRKKLSVTFICDGCGNYGSMKPSEYNRNKNHYCSGECYKLNGCKGKHMDIERITYICDNPKCDIEMTTTKARYNMRKNHYCTADCKKSHTADMFQERKLAKAKVRPKKESIKNFKDRWGEIKW